MAVINNNLTFKNETALSKFIDKFLDDKFGDKNTRSKEDYSRYINEFAKSVKTTYPAVIDHPEQIFQNFQFDEIEKSLEDYICRRNEKDPDTGKD